MDQRTVRKNKTLKLSSKGFEYREKTSANAFLEPSNPEAIFPQRKVEEIIDFRSNKNPHSGYEWRGAMRKSKPSDLIAVRNVGELVVEPVDKKEVYSSKEDLMNQLLDLKIKKHTKIRKNKDKHLRWRQGNR